MSESTATSAAASATPAASSATAPSAPLSPARTKAYLRTQSLAAKQCEAKSWGESLQRYAASRTQPLHPVMLSPPRPSKSGVFNQSTEPVAFNPLIQRFTSPEREASVAAAESASAEHARKVAQHRRDHLANHKGYNIVSNARENTSNAAVAAHLTALEQSHPTKVRIDPVTGQRIVSFRFPASHPPAREYNILTNHTSFVDSAEKLAKLDQRSLPLHNKHDLERREYNILSNRYQQHRPEDPPHETRYALEQEALEQSLREKYFRQRHYDPIALRFVHPQEEARFQEEKSAACASHGQMQLAAYPPSIKRSEGLLYDILAPNTIKDPAQLQEYYLKPERASRASHQLAHRVAREVAVRDLQQEDRTATKAHNRVSTRRYEEQLKRGHDIVTNERFEQLAQANQQRSANHLPKQRIDASGWAKLEAERNKLQAAQKERENA